MIHFFTMVWCEREGSEWWPIDGRWWEGKVQPLRYFERRCQVVCLPNGKSSGRVSHDGMWEIESMYI